MKRILACLIGLFFAMPSWAALPEGYTELEYIESTGTQYIDTGLAENLIDYMELKFETVVDSSGFMFVNGSSQVGVKDSRYGTTNPGTYVIKQNILGSKWNFTNETNGTTYLNNSPTNNSLYLFNLNVSGGTDYKNKNVKIYYYKASKNDNLVFNAVPAKRNSDNVLGMYDTVSGQFFENAGTGDFIAGPVVEIKIATTKMVDEEFAAAEAKLATTVQTIESVVSRTITQTGQIATLQAEKQTRPDETCPAGKKCLLVQDEDGTPHWYEIIEP
ncbi:MAG: hypothetical protein KBT14_01505 [Proteobacteria bacterium]|nr:hypothetical protein [Candidatus Enterousia onthequi]